MIGTCMNWVSNRKFGFIRPDGEDQDIFVHWSDAPGGQLPPSCRVSFDVVPYGKKRKAVNIKIIGGTIARQVSTDRAAEEDRASYVVNPTEARHVSNK